MPHKGVCVGGPMAGLTVHARSDVGFVAVDRPAGACWVYEIDPNDGRFVLSRDRDPSLISGDGTRVLDLARAELAGAQGLDIIALPDIPDDEGDV